MKKFMYVFLFLLLICNVPIFAGYAKLIVRPGSFARSRTTSAAIFLDGERVYGPIYDGGSQRERDFYLESGNHVVAVVTFNTDGLPREVDRRTIQFYVEGYRDGNNNYTLLFDVDRNRRIQNLTFLRPDPPAINNPPPASDSVYVPPSTPTPSPTPSTPSPAQQIQEAFRSPLQSGTYGLAGTQATISLTAIARSGIFTFTNLQGRISMGNYQIDGDRMTMQVDGYTYVYTITSSTSFSGGSETWVRIGY